jgi:ubiquinone/menaquinone biosynthesis C-methylase UbiE
MENAEKHFRKRAERYNNSSNWVADRKLIRLISDLAQLNEHSVVLDIATGTGLVAGEFYRKVKKVTGLDISRDMAEYAKGFMDEVVFDSAENMPFDDGTFDACVCRQGLQFMNLDKVVNEIHRVLKPGGVTVLCHLTAYSESDKELTFLIQELRNPARRNFFLPDDISDALVNQGFRKVENIEYFSEESVNKWINNGAISEERMQKIRDLYIKSDDTFRKIHKIRFTENDIMDEMLLVITRAKK